ncbi:unnamed protein product [Peronospora effusa]|nr:unnamed protein product [Peronospora effusa]
MKSLFLWTTRILSFSLGHRTNAIDVSVCLDATYALVSSQKSDICSGRGDNPLGSLCPLKGEVAVGDCHPFLPSFLVDGGGCILQEDTECRIITGTTWGCVLPSIGCKQQETSCPTWVVTNSDETVNIDVSHSLNGNEKQADAGTAPAPTPALTEAPTPQPTIFAPAPKPLVSSTLKLPVNEPPTACQDGNQ